MSGYGIVCVSLIKYGSGESSNCQLLSQKDFAEGNSAAAWECQMGLNFWQRVPNTSKMQTMHEKFKKTRWMNASSGVTQVWTID